MKNTSWDSVADWYDKSVNRDDSYHAQVVLPNLLRIISPKKGMNVLDVGCGQGFFSHNISSSGATVTGIDISPELIKLANTGGGDWEKGKETFIVCSAESFSNQIGKDKFDVAISVLSIQNMENVSKVFLNINDSLKKGGKFIIVLNHPCFRIPKHSSWGFDESPSRAYRRIDRYLSESVEEITMNPSIKNSEKTVSFHRPLQVYSKLLFNNGFTIARMEEWVSKKQSENGPRKIAEDKARKEIPLFMCIEAVKL